MQAVPRPLIALSLVVVAAAFAQDASPAEPSARAQKSAGTSADIDWQTSPLDLDLRGMNGERYAFRCPPGKPMPGRVAGSGPYTDDSSICTAAVHAGVIHAKDGGEVTIEIRPGQAATRVRIATTSSPATTRHDGTAVSSSSRDVAGGQPRPQGGIPMRLFAPGITLADADDAACIGTKRSKRTTRCRRCRHRRSSRRPTARCSSSAVSPSVGVDVRDTASRASTRTDRSTRRFVDPGANSEVKTIAVQSGRQIADRRHLHDDRRTTSSFDGAPRRGRHARCELRRSRFQQQRLGDRGAA